MKKLCLLFSLFLAGIITLAQSVSINTDKSAPDASAILDIKSNTKGLLIPRVSTSARNAIVKPGMGLIVYDTTSRNFWFHNGTAWTQLSGSSNNWSLTGNAVNSAVNFIGTTNQQPLRFRTNNQWSGEINPANGSVFLGSHASNDTATGFYNIGIGDHSLFLNSNGSYNTAAGVSALYSNTTGSINTAIGAYALTLNSTGSSNTAIGNNALNTNTTGYDNTAVGSNALSATTTGYYNTGVGSLALVSNTTGLYNNASGYRALYSNTSGGSNNANGAGALFSNTSGLYNTADGAAALFYNTTAYYNTASGAQALYANTTGTFNTADGALALYNNETGSYNTASGGSALLSNKTGYNNAAVGYTSLYSNTTGFYNTAMGYRSLYFNIGGYENTAFGGQALYNNANGAFNSALGINALYSNTDGINNTALGEKALYSNVTGGGNTAVGLTALYSSTGDNNTAVGLNAFTENITGTGLTAIGAGAALNGWTNLVNSTAIGYNTVVDDHNKVRVGNSNVLSIGGHVGWTTFSDGRFKQQLKEDVKGLEFIMALRPVTYIIDLPGLKSYYGTGKKIMDQPTSTILKKSEQQSFQHASIHRESGFIAQEVEQAAIKTGFTFSGVDKPGNERALYGLRYADFVVPIVKAMQEQQAVITNQQKQIDLLEKRLAALEQPHKAL